MSYAADPTSSSDSVPFLLNSSKIEHMSEKTPPWDVKALRDAVANAHGEELASKAYECAQSLAIRQDYIYYHYWEIKRLLDNELTSTDSITVARDYILGKSPKKYNEFHWKRRQAEANLIALLQSIHASYDHLAHVIYFSLNFDAGAPLRIRQSGITIYRVANKLTPGQLQDAVNSLIADSTLEHVAALVNTSKHRSIVTAPITVSFEDDTQPHGLRFKAFEYKGLPYPAQWAMPFVNTAYDTFQRHMKNVRISLHEELGI
jgi:hypothetical protein